MKITLTKPLIIGDVMYLASETVEETDAGRAKFLIDMGHAIAAAPEAKAIKKEPVKTPRSKQAEEIGESVGVAIVNAIKGGKVNA